jgi:hypothetical protein
MLLRLVQSSKAPQPMTVTLFPMTTLVRLVQPLKAPARSTPPIFVTLFGTALQFNHAYSLVRFITHKSIPDKEICQLFFFIFGNEYS